VTDRLSLYNGALAAMGERKLANLTENREPRYKLDDVWDRDMVDTLLEKGQWNFATRTVELTYSPSVTPADFGHNYGFEQPTDIIRITGMWQDGFQTTPLLHYRDEANYWWADVETIYVSYVSNDADYGADFSLWPKNFTRYAEHWMAQQVAPTIAGLNYDSDALDVKVIKWLKESMATDAM